MALDTRKLYAGMKVRSNVDAQGMRRGQEFKVVRWSSTPYPWGTVTTLVIADGDLVLHVGNPHLVLEPA